MALGANLARLHIVCYPDPVLRRTCRPVQTFDDEFRRLAERMLELMREGKGVGLAAPQVGLDICMFVCSPTGEPGDDRIVVNPVLSDMTGTCEAEEGCLSLPNITVPVRRAEKVTLRAQDVSGRRLELDGKDLEARIWQHETDHLTGRLIIDYMSEASRIANRRALKQLREADKKSA